MAQPARGKREKWLNTTSGGEANRRKVLEELETVRALLMLLLLKLGTTPDEIGTALNVTARRVRQMIPSRQIKKLPIATTGG